MVEDCFGTSPTMVEDRERAGVYYHNGDWHRTEANAIARAEEIRGNKLASLNRQIKKIEALKFGGGK
jgi:hypothetical protein